MEFSERRIACRQVDTGRTAYRISTDTDIDLLTASISAIGLIQPPVMVPEADRFVIVSGFRRFAACRQIGLRQIPVRIPNGRPAGLDLAKLAVSDNSCQRPLNLIETARAVQLLKPWFETWTDLAAVAKTVSLPENPDMLQKTARLASLPENVQHLIVNGDIALPTALTLVDLDAPSCKAVSDVLGRLHLSLNNQRELIKMTGEIAAIEDVSMADVIEDESIQRILTDPDSDTPLKARQLQAMLKQRRFPKMVEAEKQLAELMRELPVGKYWRLTPPRHLEASRFEFKATVGDRRELEEARRHLENIVRSTAMEAIFRLPLEMKGPA